MGAIKMRRVDQAEAQGQSMNYHVKKTADFFEAEVNDMVDNMSQLIEPIMISVLGGMVGTLVVAMYLPIFKMGSIM